MVNKDKIQRIKSDKDKELRTADLELALADEMAKNAELEQRQQDTELALADILAGGVV